MQVSIETTTGLERRLTVGIPASEVDTEVEKRLKEAAKKVKLNGFRQGKVPLKVVRQRFGLGVRQEVVGEVMNRSFQEAVTQEQVHPAGQPSIEPKEWGEGKDLEYVAVFEVYPEVELGQFMGYEIKRPVSEINDADVDKMIETLQKQQTTYTDVDREAKPDDRVNIDYVGTKDGEEFQGGKADNQFLVLGSGTMIPGFESGLEGTKAGDQITLDLRFPDDYNSSELAGKDVKFNVTVNSVSEGIVPEIDEAFFEKYGVSEGGESAFRDEVKGNMERELKNAVSNKVKTQVMDTLLENHEVDVPKALVQSEIQTLRQQMIQQFNARSNASLDFEKMLPDNMFEEQAQKRVRLGLIVNEIVRANSIAVDANRVREQIEELASTYEQSEEVINYYYQNSELLASIESAVLEDQVVDFITAQAQLVDESLSYEEAVKPANNNPTA